MPKGRLFATLASGEHHDRRNLSMRADPRFLPLVEKQGLMEYWRTTKSQPDVCETEDVPFCRELKKAAQP